MILRMPAWLENYKEFDMNFTHKAHILISHVPQVIQRTGKGLFYQSEEVVEAAHAKFDKFWQRYKVIDVESDKHGENLLQCVIDFLIRDAFRNGECLKNHRSIEHEQCMYIKQKFD